MIDNEPVATELPASPGTEKSWASRHPKIMILIIAGVFYAILISMCLFVLVLLLRN